jgi:hypothetical protein
LFVSGVVVGSVVSVLTLVGTAAVATTNLSGLLHLGKSNHSNATTSLTGTTNGPLVTLHNKGTGSHATGLSIKVGPSRAPLQVNSSTKVAHLNADELDGKSASQFQQPVASPCASGRAIASLASNGAAGCTTYAIYPINATATAGNGATPPSLSPAPVFLDMDCHVPQRGTDIEVTNEDSVATTLNWLTSDGTTTSATGTVLEPFNTPGDEHFFDFTGKRLEGQIIYKGTNYIMTLNIHAYDGTTSCEYAGTVTVVQSSG